MVHGGSRAEPGDAALCHFTPLLCPGKHPQTAVAALQYEGSFAVDRMEQYYKTRLTYTSAIATMNNGDSCAVCTKIGSFGDE
jgi:hypothetical protein